ncbi:hypothetical protein WH50_05755 [Pokkaliibacter plantistimulans]|uniref:N-acetyltransferase domain-containing protein n=1 Tax=Pokkaliibacter plantistimulans TaxID=1635171 RepID=A0ABX5M018_9GAMM|nr:GNAT family protein [Pokkaliibacter plantistimulans]PXF32229.1 hypothetical protein WH50_05755 [Pokkaliibacter plantistimulans]
MFRRRVDDDLSLGLCLPDMAIPLFALIDSQRAYLRQWLPWVDDTHSSDDTLAFLRQQLQLLAEREAMSLTILYQGQLAGCLGLQQVDWRLQSAKIGYWLAEPYQGKGIMQRCLSHLLALAFEEWQLAKLEIRVASSNLRSRRLPEALGFRHEGTLRRAERLQHDYVDHELYGLLHEEWLTSKR